MAKAAKVNWNLEKPLGTRAKKILVTGASISVSVPILWVQQQAGFRAGYPHFFSCVRKGIKCQDCGKKTLLFASSPSIFNSEISVVEAFLPSRVCLKVQTKTWCLFILAVVSFSAQQCDLNLIYTRNLLCQCIARYWVVQAHKEVTFTGFLLRHPLVGNVSACVRFLSSACCLVPRKKSSSLTYLAISQKSPVTTVIRNLLQVYSVYSQSLNLCPVFFKRC